VIIYDALTLKVLNKVAACQSKVAAMSFCRHGTLLATASEQGTVVRVFTVPGAQQVGVSYTLWCIFMRM
jgi:autophagy-related protein 18